MLVEVGLETYPPVVGRDSVDVVEDAFISEADKEQT